MKTPTIILSATLFMICGCASFERYLDEHRDNRASQSFSYVQVGRVEFQGSFPIEMLYENNAWPLTAEDAQAIRESLSPVVVEPRVVNGHVIYPSIVNQPRCVRIAHHVRGFVDQEPPPSWKGPIVHETTRVPWSGDESARYENGWRYERNYQRTKDDRLDGRTPADAPSTQQGTKP